MISEHFIRSIINFKINCVLLAALRHRDPQIELSEVTCISYKKTYFFQINSQGAYYGSISHSKHLCYYNNLLKGNIRKKRS